MNKSRPTTPGTPGSNIGPMGEHSQSDYVQWNAAATNNKRNNNNNNNNTHLRPDAAFVDVPISPGATGNNNNSSSTTTSETATSTPVTGGPPAPPAAAQEKWQPGQREDGKIELTEEDAWQELGYCFPSWKKWTILTVIFLVQTSMNFDTSLYSNGIKGISEEFNVSEQAARAGAAIFLITYAFGCELWAPWSEELGRKPILQASMTLVNIFTLPVALAPNFGCLLAGRALGGLSMAGGSVTLGMVADLFEADNQQMAVAYIVFSSVGGSILGPIIGGFVEANLRWTWCIWIQLIFGGFVQILHLFLVPETRTTILLDRIAKKRRESGQSPNVYGPNELEPFFQRFTLKELLWTWVRPFRMFLTEPIVLTLSLLSGFSDALIFMQIQSFALVYKQWGFGAVTIGLSFIPIGIGYIIAWLSFIPAIRRNRAQRKANPEDEHAQYESRLWWLLYTAPCLPIGLIIFAWTSGGPPIHWIGTMFGSAIIGIANYAIYMATIDYMICAYGPYSASATGGNGWSRDFLAGVLTVPATPFYSNIGGSKHLQYASTILFCISLLLVVFVYIIYWKGPALRKRSPFAQSLASAARSGSAAASTTNGPGAGPPPGAARGRRVSRLPSTQIGYAGFQERRRSSAAMASSRRSSAATGAGGAGSRRSSYASGAAVTPGSRPGLAGRRTGSYGFGGVGAKSPAVSPGVSPLAAGPAVAAEDVGPRHRMHQAELREWQEHQQRRNSLIREATVESERVRM